MTKKQIPNQGLKKQLWVCVEWCQFPDFIHSEWVCICDNPDADKLVFSESRYLGIGFLRCEPLVLGNGSWII